MAQRILIFKIFFLIFLFSFNISHGKIIIGKAKIIDGDTIHISNKKIRLHGIDAPETKQTCLFENKKWNCGQQSTRELKKIINKKTVKCITSGIDRYERYIATCYVNKLNVNQTMVRKGWAIAYRYYSKNYIMDENYAKKNKVGIWKSKFEEPYIFRKKK